MQREAVASVIGILAPAIPTNILGQKVKYISPARTMGTPGSIPVLRTERRALLSASTSASSIMRIGFIAVMSRYRAAGDGSATGMGLWTNALVTLNRVDF